MTEHYRQEVLNVILAQLLQERGVITAPESIIRSGVKRERRMPDLIIVNFHGLRTAIEGEVGDHADAPDLALASARLRVEQGIAHIGVAIVYPPALRGVSFAILKRELASSRLQIAIVTESEDTGFVPGDVAYLESALRHSFEHLVREDVVAGAVFVLDAGIEQFAGAIATKSGVVGRVAEALGIRELPDRAPAEEDEDE